MAIIKPKLSSLVTGQLPEFVREDYQTFVAFIEAYYEYLESQVLVDLNTVGDIDTTLDSFVKYFKNEVALNFPATLIDDKFLLPKLKELYVSKGTVSSYNLLFRILYNKEIIISKPETQMLRVSDGKWVQDVSIFVSINIGLPTDIVGRTVDIISNDRLNLKKISVYVDSYRTTSNPNVYEFFIQSGFTGTFNVGDILNYAATFTGVIKATTSTLVIEQSGKNFKAGQTYNIGGTGTGSTIKVESIDIYGGIKTAKFINYGIGYSDSFNTSILALSNQLSNINNYFTVTGGSPSINASINDSVDQISDIGVISIYDYATTVTSPYVDSTYVGRTLASFVDTASSSSVVDLLSYAKLSINIGSIAKYPGYFANDDGFISNMYIQDSKYYQAYSYAIQIDELFESYKSVVKNLIHPTGTEIFGEYNINIVFDCKSDINIQTVL